MAYSAISKSSSYFNTVLYTGANQTITGVGFQPDWSWIKQRNNASSALFDAVRGATKFVESNATNAEVTDATTLTAFGSDGFTLGADSSGYVGGSSQATVAWNWKANGSGSANSDGSINSTVSVDTTSGFSIVKYTGTGATATVGHGLGVAPKVVLIKGVSNSGSWGMYHSSIGATKKIILNSTAAETSSGWMNNTAPTSSVFTVINDADVGSSGYTYVAYCFAEKTGFSKFELYEGTGNSDGPFLYTGFKPSFVMIKAKGQTESWYMLDNKRPGYNTNNYYLKANATDAEGTSTTLATTLCSNGFKINNSDTSMNSSGQGYIYMAFGQPIVSTNGDIATAR